MHTTTPGKYRQDIDGLRAISVLLVLIFHFSLVPAITAGFIGVDVFFVISGFLITGIITRQLEAGTFSFSDFYVARVRRLAPALVATLVATFCAGLVLLFPDDLRELATQLIAAQAYVANVYFWRTVNYFGLSGANVFLLHTWSLAVEEQFYVLYPVVLFLLHRYVPKRWFIGIAALFLLSFGLNAALVNAKPEAVFYLLPTRAWELLAGALTARTLSRLDVSRLGKQALGVAGLALIAAGAFLYRADYRFPGYFALVPVLGASAILFAHDARSTVTARVLQWRPLRYLGRISYPLYLVHWPLHVFAGRVLGNDYGRAWHVAMFLLAIVLAAAIHHGVEQPVRRGRLLVARRALLTRYAAALAATVVAVVGTRATGGWPARFPAEVVRLANFVNDKSAPLLECEFSGRSNAIDLAHACTIGSADVAPRWVVFGDSHAWATHDAFDLWLKSRHESAAFVFRHGCPPLANVRLFGDDGTCFRFNVAILELARRAPSIDSMVLVSTWRQGRERIISTHERRQPSDAESLKLFGQGFASEVAQLRASGKRVYVWKPLPGATANVPIAMAQAALHGRPAGVDKSRADYLEEYAFFFDSLNANRTQLAGVLSPGDVLCSAGACATSAGGDPLYFDNSHPTRSSAPFFAQMLAHSDVR